MKETRHCFTVKLLLAAALLLTGWGLPGLQKAEAAQERYSSEVEFDFKYQKEERRVVPRVRVTKVYFDDGRVETDIREFPDQALPLPKSAQYLDETRERDDPSLSQTFYDGCRFYYGTHVLNTQNGPKAFTVYCDSTRDKKKNAKGVQTARSNYRVYAYDVASSRLSLLNKAEAPTDDPPPVDLYTRFGGYGILGPYGEQNYEKKQNRVYSIVTNKLLARTAEHPQEDLSSGTLRFTEYQKLSNDPKVLAKLDYYVSTSYGHFKAKTIVLHPDGTRTVPQYKEPLKDVYYEQKVGSYTYAAYKKPDSEDRMVGYRTSSGFKPLSRADASSSFYLLRSGKFLVIRQQTPKEKTLRIVDAKTAKAIVDIPDVGGWISEEVGDSIARLGADSKDYYIHLPTGIITRNMENSQLIQSDTGGYTGAQDKLVSMQAPPQMYINGKQVRYAGQGPFLTRGNRWYVEVNDFAKAADTTVTRTANGIVLVRGTYKMTVSKNDPTALRWKGQTFVPLETLNEKLGMAGGFVDSPREKGYTSKALRIFSKDLKEEDVIARPDLYEALDGEANMAQGHYYAMRNGKPASMPLTGTNVYYGGGMRLIFKNGVLVNVASVSNVDGRTLRNVIFDINPLKYVIAAYGTPQATKTGGQMVRWYKVEGKTLVFESSSVVTSAYYIVQ
ncbi:hypothetical protein QWJ34_11765 [Saccharibacillus sp. CPCC 101409]|uniref:hypothetical protein n=1 Tax=Saccharibacillus sp. CPCC 101409 TaxID=3058041 RepID=UPI0026728F97|nr:hypothetical protein [Saccharibacillus sp. CPCC 101409]MDO3410440.1 hypothetical protein [Saccharibacillus sp. CPCC 101409]